MQVEKARYTPLYTGIECSMAGHSLSSVQLFPLAVGLAIDVSCENPNPYTLRVQTHGLAPFWLGEDRTEAGTVEMPEEIALPGASGGKAGQGTFTVQVSAGGVSIEATPALILGSLDSEIESYIKFDSAVIIEADIVGLSVAVADLAMDEYCGSVVQLSENQVGEIACGESLDALGTPPPIGDTIAPSEQIDEELRSGERTRDIVFDGGFVLCLVLGLPCLAVPLGRALRERGACGRGWSASGRVRPGARPGPAPEPSKVGNPQPELAV